MSGRTGLHASRQEGTALVIALVLLLSVTLLSLASVSNSVLEMKMAGADEDRMQTFQAADSAISMVVNDFGDYVDGLADDEVRCINQPGGCANGNVLDTSNVFESGDQLNVTLSLAGSDLQPIRIRDTGIAIEGEGTLEERIGAMDTSARRFEYIIEAQLDRRASNRGFAHVWRGFSRQVSTLSQTISGDISRCGDGGGGADCG